ncbi:MAG: hypothetical protein EB119_01655 [Synechococcaceae bacterium WBB_34_004]|nr:hypothetical protein [Synechococcaceae bacterium WBB_34_004]
MALTLSESAKQERKLPEAGATIGVLYSLVDLGHQKTNWDNEEKWTPKVRLTFELPDQTDEFEVVENDKTTKVEKPMVVSIEQTRSLGEKASLRKLLEQWRGQTFTSRELQAFSLKNLLGKPAMLTLIHKTSQQGRQYCAIAGASKLPKGMKAPATTANAHLYYEIEQGEGGQFNDMPEWLQDKIRASKEFATAAGKSTATKVEVDEDGNQVPF